MVVRGTPKDLAEQLRVEVYGGWTSRNEAREEMGRGPEEGLDVFLEPTNMTEAGTQSGESEPSERKLQHLDPLIQRFAEQVTNAESKASDEKLAGIIYRNLQPLAQAGEAAGGEKAENVIERFADQYQKGGNHVQVVTALIEGLNDEH